MRPGPRLTVAAVLALTSWFFEVGLLAALPQGSPGEFRISTNRAGVHRVTFEAMADAGLAPPGLPTESLALSSRGDEVPLWIEDQGDGRFGPGDWFEFVATQLHGSESYFHGFSPYNVYWLRFLEAGGLRIREETSRSPAPGEDGQRWRRRVHLERDRLLIRLGTDQVGEVEEPELWFWKKLTHVDDDSVEIPLDLAGLAIESTEPVRLAVHFRALSSQVEESRSELFDHQVDLTLGDRQLKPVRWDGRIEHLALLDPLSAGQLGDSAQPLSLSLRIPRRQPEGGTDPLVDVVMLNWLEVDYPHDGSVGREQVELSDGGRPGAALRLTSQEGRELVVYSPSGTRIQLADPARNVIFGDSAEGTFWAVPHGAFFTPARIEIDLPSDLASADNRADYLIIAHERLLDSAQALAELHRDGGLDVALIDVQDIYDEFGDGIVHPRAIRDFISHAYHSWQAPRPRYVLLVGDASWDTKNSSVNDARYANWVDRQLLAPGSFRAQKIQTYEGNDGGTNRNLIPTFSFATREGHAASDNWFVAVDGDDIRPDLAIGRLPVIDTVTLDGIIGKIRRYTTEPKVGPWRRNTLWITNEWSFLQDHSRSIEADLRPRGLAPTWIFPSSQDKTNEHHQAYLTEALNAGQLLVHFAGHGGRYIWRTGPRDLGSKNVDLFTLDHVQALRPNDRLPVVFSMTCHSGPFDHPNADSIAEAFLRLPDRGAIAVVAASWRTSAALVKLSRELMTEFTLGGRIGDAFVRAKRNLSIDDLIATYNLLGDPALTLSLPGVPVHLAIRDDALGRRLTLALDAEAFEGRALVDFVDLDGDLAHSEELEVNSPSFDLPWPAGFNAGVVRAYLWSEEENTDAIGTLVLEPTPEAAAGL